MLLVTFYWNFDTFTNLMFLFLYIQVWTMFELKPLVDDVWTNFHNIYSYYFTTYASFSLDVWCRQDECATWMEGSQVALTFTQSIVVSLCENNVVSLSHFGL